MTKIADLTADRVRSLFNYDPVTGCLTWRVRPLSDFATKLAWAITNSRNAGKVAGCSRPDGYRLVRIGGRLYREHRLIWLYVHGVWPDEIDHVEGEPGNNRDALLHDGTHASNLKNARRPKDNKSGIAGVHWCRRTKRWRVRIGVDGTHVHIGRFETLDEAATARRNASKKYGFSERHGEAV